VFFADFGRLGKIIAADVMAVTSLGGKSGL
jgi:hypothetical protein